MYVSKTQDALASLTEADIRGAITPNAFAAAEAYVRAGRVQRVQGDPELDLIEAKVQGSAKKPYSQMIWLRRGRGGKITVEGECSCPVEYNCKHVGAVLLTTLRRAPAPLPQATPASAPAKPAAAFTLLSSPAPLPVPSVAPAPANPALATPLTTWLRGLEEEAAAESEDYPAGVTKRLFYILSRLVQPGPPLLSVGLALSDMRRDGTISPRYTNPQINAYTQANKYLRPSDRFIISHLGGSTVMSDRGGDPAAAMRAILATGRARLGSFPGVVATEGPPRPAALDWQLGPDGNQRPVLSVEGGGAPVLLPVPWYMDETTGQVGPADIAIPPRVLRRILEAPPVPPDAAAAVRDQLNAVLPGAPIPPPRELPHGGTLGGNPVPHLHLHNLRLPVFYSPLDRPAEGAITLGFRYGPALIPADHASPEVIHDGTRYTLTRAPRPEQATEDSLGTLGLRRVRHALRHLANHETAEKFIFSGRDPESDWLEFMLQGVPTLRDMGWEIAIDADFPYNVIRQTGPLQAEIREGSGIDWFDLDLGVLVGGERVDLVPALVALLSRHDAGELYRTLRESDPATARPLILNLPDGRRLALDMAAVRPVLLTLFDLFGAGGIAPTGNTLKLSRGGAADLAALESAGVEAGLVWRGGEALRALGRQLHDRGGIPEAPVPAWFNATLRPYQQRGVDWLQFLREAGLAGVLADDMGLGKTVQTLAHLAVDYDAGRLTKPALVICPTSVVGNWVREANRFAPNLRVLPLQGSDRKTRFTQIPESDLVISTYPLLSRDTDVLTEQEWHSVILDEAQTVKNPAATMSHAVRQLRAGQRLCLTGTPMENHLGELWALFDFMMPGFLGTALDFGRRFRTPIEKAGNTELHAQLAKRVAPFLLRRTKSEVAKDLPPRTDIVENVQMQTAQRGVYEAVRLAMHARVQEAIAQQGLAKSGIVILDALLKMRQVCCDPRLLKLPAAKQKAGSAKLERLLELLGTLREEGRSILLFSQFTSMLALIEESIKPLGMNYVTLTGDTRDRAKPVDDFQAGKVKLFLISLKAGGVGLNLTAADTVIHYDPWWNPAVENQATDRAHRIGQTKSVFVHRLITENTIEEKMEVLKARKSALADGILSGAGSSALRITEDDVQMLFG